jgi:DUF971 family protein
MAEHPSNHESLTADPCRPVGLDLQLAAQNLRITWADGLTSLFPLAWLRRHCPCATCRTEHDRPALLPILSPRQTADVHVTNAELVGNYAIRFDWSDGHNTGIYDFRLLRQLHRDLPTSGGS